MEHAVVVEEAYGLRQWAEERQGFFLGQRPACVCYMMANVVGQGLPIDKLHDVVGRLVRVEDLVDRYDIGTPAADFVQAAGFRAKRLPTGFHLIAVAVGAGHAAVV